MHESLFWAILIPSISMKPILTILRISLVVALDVQINSPIMHLDLQALKNSSFKNSL